MQTQTLIADYFSSVNHDSRSIDQLSFDSHGYLGLQT